jgi:hypothetical protein
MAARRTISKHRLRQLMKRPRHRQPRWLQEELDRKGAKGHSSSRSGKDKKKTPRKMVTKRRVPEHKPRRGDVKSKRCRPSDPYVDRNPNRGRALDWEW